MTQNGLKKILTCFWKTDLDSPLNAKNVNFFKASLLLLKKKLNFYN